MRHKNYFISLLLLLAALTASAQTCPGPPNRTALINLQKSNIVNGTRWGQTVLTDTCGNQRYVTLDSIIVIVVDSIAADTALQVNWYTHNGTTTNPTRTAMILQSAEWLGDDPNGSLYWQMGELSGGRALTTPNQSSIFYDALSGSNNVRTDDAGVTLRTSVTASRAVNIYTDTVNTRGSFDDTNFRLNFLSDFSYLYADSLKVVGLGQFPEFPTLNFDGTEKGFFYDPYNGSSVYLMNGDGVSQNQSNIRLYQTGLELVAATDATYTDVAYLYAEPGNAGFVTQDPSFTYSRIGLTITEQPNLHIVNIRQIGNVLDTNRTTTLFLGESNNVVQGYFGRRAFGISTQIPNNLSPTETFYWILNYLPNDTTENAVSFYNRAYYWKNEHPIGASPTDTLFHFWAATGPGGEAGKDPGFMTLDQVCDHCAESVVNWYTSNGTTTDNTRIADVLETATWRSADVTADGVYPFRFELDGLEANEPEMMVWKFPTPNDDSLTLAQSDQEIFFRSTNLLLLWADEYLNLLGDSVRLGHAENVSTGDILVLAGADGSPGNVRTVKSLEGTFNADVLSWSAGAAGDRWDAVPANRSAIIVTAGTGTTSPALSVQEILVDGAGGGTISLDYTPAMPSASYTTVRYIYNEGGDASVTVDTDQAWEFRDTTGDLGASFSLAAGANAKLIWIYNATPADARFFVILF